MNNKTKNLLWSPKLKFPKKRLKLNWSFKQNNAKMFETEGKLKCSAQYSILVLTWWLKSYQKFFLYLSRYIFYLNLYRYSCSYNCNTKIKLEKYKLFPVKNSN